MKTTILLGSLALVLSSCLKRESTTDSSPAAEAAAAKPYPLEVCLVSGEKLGSMGEPHVIVHEGQEIKFCCDNCEPAFRKDQEKYLSQLEAD